jgi:acyl-CoA thioester hydrolase
VHRYEFRHLHPISTR